MKRILIVILLAVSLPASYAAIQYEFQQTTRGNDNQGSSEVSGKAFLDGNRSRVEYTRNSVFGPGAYVLSHLSERTMYVVNPKSKSYYDVQLSTVANTLGSGKIEVSNLKASTRKLDDHSIIAGVPTDHYKFESSYDMTVLFGRLPLKQSVHTTVETWTTGAFGQVPAPIFAATDFTTGNPELDKLIAAETSKVEGLVLRRVVTITTGAKNTKPAARPDVKLNISRSQTSEVLVTSVSNVQLEPKFFLIPEGFARVAPKREELDGKEVPPSKPAVATRGGV